MEKNKLISLSRSYRALQALARRLLTEQEEESHALSLTLHDEIGQTLLGIDVRLLALKNQIPVNTAAFRKDVAITQDLVERALSTINRFAAERGASHEK